MSSGDIHWFLAADNSSIVRSVWWSLEGFVGPSIQPSKIAHSVLKNFLIPLSSIWVLFLKPKSFPSMDRITNMPEYVHKCQNVHFVLENHLLSELYYFIFHEQISCPLRLFLGPVKIWWTWSKMSNKYTLGSQMMMLDWSLVSLFIYKSCPSLGEVEACSVWWNSRLVYYCNQFPQKLKFRV